MLQAGSLGLLGLNLAQCWSLRAAAASADAAQGAGFGKAKSCILLFMWGGPSQLDTFDPKPHAPDQIRGQFSQIDTNVPGINISEHFASVAKVCDKLAIVRSLTHNDPAHLSSAHFTLTGHRAPVVNSDADPPGPRDTPHMGSVVSYVRHASGDLPGFVTVPWITSHPAAPGGRAPGQNAGWLGQAYDPLVIQGDPSDPKWSVPELALQADLTAARLESRRELLGNVDRQRALCDQSADAANLDEFQQRAFGLLSSTTARRAFDLEQEPVEVRERYGRNIHGQCVLLARRLVEHGVPLVAVNWHNDGRNFWDTHGNNFRRLKKDLIPPADQALSALLEDLDQRGLLDETLVAWVGEFGRRPQIEKSNAGREHWPFCYSGLLAGGGIRGGTVYGASDKHAAYPRLSPVGPGDYAATMLHALGISPAITLPDALGRPMKVTEGQPILELFG